MPLSNYLKLLIDKQQVDLGSLEEVPISISYKKEDADDFQSKKSSEALNISVPATMRNNKIANTFYNPAFEDLTADDHFNKPVNCVIEAGGQEVFVGKAFLKSASHTDVPNGYVYDCFGDNADWIIDLKDATLYDFLKQISFVFTDANIQASWAFDGTSEALPYVFAPVRYREPMDKYAANFVMISPPMIEDYNMRPEYMKPSISAYWLIYWAFKSVGYKVESSFFDSNYFRRAVMPWTWGNFIYSDGTKQENLKFLAKSSEDFVIQDQSYSGFVNSKVDNDSTNGGFDNNNVYAYNSGTFAMVWTYSTAFPYGSLKAHMHISVLVNSTVTANSDAELRVSWYKNGVLITGGDVQLMNLNAPTVGRRDFASVVEDFRQIVVSPGDTISAKLYIHTFDSGLGRAYIKINVEAFELEFLETILGSTIDFGNYTAFKKHKFLDFLRGIVDDFNIIPSTDPVNKVVVMEPAHPYATGDDQSIKVGGYLNGKFLDWSAKQDLSQKSELTLYSEGERELLFKFKDDNNDGILKKVQDRNNVTAASAKYILPERFTTGQKPVENRFFSAVMHYDVMQWAGLSTKTPQMICLVPENISNTSNTESENTFNPKLAWYKGQVALTGWKYNGLTRNSFPFMFAVNYTPGGENDPIFSYSDEKIGNDLAGYVTGKGLLKRFFIQRMASLRLGKIYSTWLRLNNNDVTNWHHREHKIVNGQKWELLEIIDYKPLMEQSTSCVLRKVAPVLPSDFSQVFPSTSSVSLNILLTSNYDTKYTPLKCLPSDIPK
jgi:hypothetical protein